MKYTLISIFIILLNSAFTIQAIESKPKPNEQFSIKFAAYNVLFGLWGVPESIGEKLKKYNLDIICFNEVPNGDWTKRVGTILNLNHTYVGEISSANHKNKYKSILSRFPLYNKGEIEINANGWKPASLVYANTKVKTVTVVALVLRAINAAIESKELEELFDKIATDRQKFLLNLQKKNLEKDISSYNLSEKDEEDYKSIKEQDESEIKINNNNIFDKLKMRIKEKKGITK